MADTPKSPRWMRIALVVSLALNLLILGGLAGATFLRGPGGHAERALGPFARAFEEEHRDAFRSRLNERSEPLRQNRSEVRKAFKAILATLRAETFDPTEFEEAVAHQVKQLTAFQFVGQEALVEQLATMTLDERRAFADRLEKSFRHGPHRQKRE